MKTTLLGLTLFLLSLTAFSQSSTTAFSNVKVIATAGGSAVELSWKKGAEDVAYFIVERSTNGVDFTRCGLVFTSEDPAFSDYKFRDKTGAVSQGLVYRLALVSNQKQITYLQPKTLIAPEAL